MSKKLTKKKVTKKEVERVQKIITDKLTTIEKDRLLAFAILSIGELSQVLETILDEKNLSLTKKEKREIERIVSLGPKWLNYTVKMKDKN